MDELGSTANVNRMAIIQRIVGLTSESPRLVWPLPKELVCVCKWKW